MFETNVGTPTAHFTRREDAKFAGGTTTGLLVDHMKKSPKNEQIRSLYWYLVLS